MVVLIIEPSESCSVTANSKLSMRLDWTSAVMLHRSFGPSISLRKCWLQQANVEFLILKVYATERGSKTYVSPMILITELSKGSTSSAKGAFTPISADWLNIFEVGLPSFEPAPKTPSTSVGALEVASRVAQGVNATLLICSKEPPTTFRLAKRLSINSRTAGVKRTAVKSKKAAEGVGTPSTARLTVYSFPGEMNSTTLK
mmetsp:Transcript_14047/g.30022  ORF Transcript_14047/g.30022 Transcript_14047/m.30022 type:complete len:201 (-) Transcript_14047:606-1208(-)